MDPLELLTAEIKEEETENTIAAFGRLDVVAIAIGPERVRNELIPFIKAYFEQENDEAHAVIATQLGAFVPFVGGPDHALIVLELLETMSNMEETVIRDNAVESVRKVVKQMNTDDVVNHAFPMTKRLCASEWMGGKISACGCFASVYPYVSSDSQHELLGWFTRLSNDETPMVRVACYVNIGDLAAVTEKELVKTHLLPIVKNLLEDSLESMRIYTIEAAVGLCRGLESKDMQEHIAPILAGIHDDASWKIRQQFEKFIDKMLEVMPPDMFGPYVIPLFAKHLEDPDNNVRLTAARQLEKIAEFCVSSVTESKEESLRDTTPINSAITEHIGPKLDVRSHDDNDKVRVCFSAALPLLCVPMGPTMSAKYLLPIVLAMSKDENPEVRNNVTMNLSKLIIGLPAQSVEDKILPMIVELAKDVKWRVRMEVVGQSCVLSKQLGQQCFEKKIKPIVTGGLRDHVFAIREKACQQIAELTKLWGLDFAQLEIIPSALQLYKQSTNYLHRMTALICIENVAKLMKPEQMDASAVPLLVEACKDEVANVRFHTCRTIQKVLPYLSKATITQRIKPALASLTKDQDADVRYFSEETLKACDRQS